MTERLSSSKSVVVAKCVVLRQRRIARVERTGSSIFAGEIDHCVRGDDHRRRDVGTGGAIAAMQRINLTLLK